MNDRFSTSAWRIFGVASVAIGAYSLLWHVVELVDPWLFKRPLWIGLDRPAGYDSLLAFTNQNYWSALALTILGIILAVLLIVAGARLMSNSRDAFPIIKVWIAGKLMHAIAVAALTFATIDAQLTGIPDPRAPLYNRANVLVMALAGLGIGFIVRVTYPLAMTLFLVSLRRRRGLCPACTYPVGTSEVCTECGAKLPSPSC